MAKISEVNGDKRAKFLGYAAGFFLLMFIAASFSRWVNNEDFYPVWLIWLFLALFLITIVWSAKITRKELVETAPPLKNTPVNTESTEERMKRWQEHARRESEAHDLILKICEAKNIRLRLKQEGKSGHCEIPEIWTLEKAVPLAPEDLYAITKNGVISLEKEVREDGIIYVTKFTRGGGWTIYEQETPESEENV